jgi:hypothetical protein
MSDTKLKEWLEIRKVHEAYFFCIDRKKWGSVAECFSDDSVSFYNGNPDALVGPQNVVLFIQKALANSVGTIHSIGSIKIEVDGKKATSWISAIVHLPYPDRNIVSIRAIHYFDKLEKRKNKWKIVNRIHKPIWQYEMNLLVPNLHDELSHQEES